MHKITKLKITNYRGVRALEATIGPNGAIIKGRNASGKTSALRAIRAALAAQDISADAITIGEDRAEIVVDVDDVTVQRVITPKTTSVKASRGGMQASKPQTFLNELLGNSPLDPLDFYLKKDKERRAVVLEALPVKVTREQLRAFAPVDDSVDVSGHGLEVLERVRSDFYDRRTLANKAADNAKREHERLAGLLGKIPKTDGPSTAIAQAELDAARAEAASLHQKEIDARAAEERQKTARESIDELRRAAASLRSAASGLPNPEREEEKRKACDAKKAEIDAVKKKLAELQKEHATLCDELDDLIAKNESARTMLVNADDKERTANEAEATLNATIEHVTEDDVARVRARVEKATAGVAAAKARAEREQLAQQVAHAGEEARVTAKAADDLDAIVRRLTKDAPAEIAKNASAIPGLTLEGEKVFVDGVDIEKRSGAEQMRFAITLAKRLNAKSKILVVDGLERLDPEACDRFIEMATEDEWQLIATRVDRGDVVIEAIERTPASGHREARA